MLVILPFLGPQGQRPTHNSPNCWRPVALGPAMVPVCSMFPCSPMSPGSVGLGAAARPRAALGWNKPEPRLSQFTQFQPERTQVTPSMGPVAPSHSHYDTTVIPAWSQGFSFTPKMVPVTFSMSTPTMAPVLPSMIPVWTQSHSVRRHLSPVWSQLLPITQYASSTSQLPPVCFHSLQLLSADCSMIPVAPSHSQSPLA